MPPTTCPTWAATRRREYDAGHIPGARFFDIDEIADARPAPLPHMAAPVEKFMSRMRAMGGGRRPPGGGL